MTLYIQLDILLCRRFAIVIYNIAYAFVSILLFHVLLLLNHLMPHAMFARHRGHGTTSRTSTKHQKWRMAIALPWRISLSLRFNPFRFPVCVGFQVHYCNTSMAVIISSIVTSPSNVQLHANLHGRRMFVSDASYSTLRSFPYAVP